MFDRNFIESFLKDYSDKEKIEIEKDLRIVKSLILDDVKANSTSLNSPVYLATAGGPGSLKTTTMESYLTVHNLKNFVYADPDQILKNMNFTYRKSLSNYNFAVASSNYEALKNAYDKWRNASNYICHQILQIALNDDNKGEKYSVAHGMTATSPHIKSLFEGVKKLGYDIVLLLCYSPDETRKEAISRRETEQGFVQTDPKDIISKGLDFPKRFDIYFEYAKEISFYWNKEPKHGELPLPCARYLKDEDGNVHFSILRGADWKGFCAKYISDCQQQEIKCCDRLIPLIPKPLLEQNSAPLSSITTVFGSMYRFSPSSNVENIKEVEELINKH